MAGLLQQQDRYWDFSLRLPVCGKRRLPFLASAVLEWLAYSGFPAVSALPSLPESPTRRNECCDARANDPVLTCAGRLGVFDLSAKCGHLRLHMFQVRIQPQRPLKRFQGQDRVVQLQIGIPDRGRRDELIGIVLQGLIPVTDGLRHVPQLEPGGASLVPGFCELRSVLQQ